MKAAILVLFLLVQGIVGLPWQLPDKDDPNRCSYPAVFLPYESRQCGIAKGGHGWLSFPVRVCSDSKCSCYLRKFLKKHYYFSCNFRGFSFSHVSCE